MCLFVLVASMDRRYKLFGDTVNMASRMESTSLPGHIQLSESCYVSLCISSKRGYETRQRGGVNVKGKGENIQTYWLLGQDGACGMHLLTCAVPGLSGSFRSNRFVLLCVVVATAQSPMI